MIDLLLTWWTPGLILLLLGCLLIFISRDREDSLRPIDAVFGAGVFLFLLGLGYFLVAIIIRSLS